AMKRLVLSVLLLLVIVVIAGLASPWPSVLVIRAIFDHGAAQASKALEPLVPNDVAVQTGLVYDPSDADGRLDIYRGKAATPDGPVVVWFHGGGFVSGRRADLANYLKILAGKGFTVVNVDYTIAPDATYPTPIRQANMALAFLSTQASQLKINAN
ncbi:alpha/beta hydrolase, partial [Escherichia coli]|nr:alpha/beta hydrolase [Escherichia coli]